MFAKPKQQFVPKNLYMSKALAVKEYAYQEEMNAGFRNYMEDGPYLISSLLIFSFFLGYFIKDNILQDGGKSILFGLFDGHGGRVVVDFLIENFIAEFLACYKQENKDISKLFEMTFLNVIIPKKNQKKGFFKSWTKKFKKTQKAKKSAVRPV